VKLRSFGIHVGQRFHSATHKLFRSTDYKETLALHEEALTLARACGVADQDGYHHVFREIIHRVSEEFELPRSARDPLTDMVASLAVNENWFLFPDIDWDENRTTSQWWALRDELLQLKAFLKNFDTQCSLIEQVCVQTIAPLYQRFPDLGRKVVADTDDIRVPSPLIHLLGTPGVVIEEMFREYFDPAVLEAETFQYTTDQLRANIIAASGGDPAAPETFTKTPVQPSASGITDPVQLANTYLDGTPLLPLLDQTVPFAIPAAARREHHHICAGTGFGKTQTLQYLINEDLPAVARGERSLVVIDSQDDLINTIKGLKEFAPGEPLHDKLVLIDPTDVEYPVALNLFDVGMERVETYDPLKREQLTNSILEIYDFVLGTLLDAGMTQKQSVIFRYVARLMLSVENATIHTLRDLLEPDGHKHFTDDIGKLDGSARHFFETQFNTDQYKQTKQQILWRLYSILENQTFERMFSHPRSKLDLYTELNSGKVILINTAKSLLKETGSQFFGRFFIALIAHAAQERSALKADDRMSTMLILDEMHEYCDATTDTLLASARKYGLGMVLAHQYLGQLSPKLQEAIATNTSIKFVGGVSTKDANALAPMLRCSSDFIENQPKGTFAASIRGVTSGAVPLQFPFGVMEDKPRMDAAEWANVQSAMRERYAVHHTRTPDVEEEESEQRAEPVEEEQAPSETSKAQLSRAIQEAMSEVDDAPIYNSASALDHIDLTATETW